MQYITSGVKWFKYAKLRYFKNFLILPFSKHSIKVAIDSLNVSTLAKHFQAPNEFFYILEKLISPKVNYLIKGAYTTDYFINALYWVW